MNNSDRAKLIRHEDGQENSKYAATPSRSPHDQPIPLTLRRPGAWRSHSGRTFEPTDAPGRRGARGSRWVKRKPVNLQRFDSPKWMQPFHWWYKFL